MKRHACLSALLFSLAATSAWAAPKPSFDCAKARTSVEKAICADDGLAAQDASVGKNYNRARKSFDPEAAKALTQDQRYFVQVRDDSYAEPFGSGTPAEELANRLKYRDAFLASLSLKKRAGFEGDWENLAGGFSVKKQADGSLLVDGSAAHPQNGRWQQNPKEAEHQLLREQYRQQHGACRQQPRLQRRLLPATRHQQAKDQGGHHVQRVVLRNEHPVWNFTHRAKQQQPTHITPLAARCNCRCSRQIRCHRQAKPRECQAPRDIQQIDGVTDISQVIEHHAQKRQPLEQIQCTVALL